MVFLIDDLVIVMDKLQSRTSLVFFLMRKVGNHMNYFFKTGLILRALLLKCEQGL